MLVETWPEYEGGGALVPAGGGDKDPGHPGKG